MRSRLVAQLDRQIRLHGEKLQLRRTVSATARNRLNLRGIVKPNGLAQLIANIAAAKYIIIISPTSIKNGAWPGGLSPVGWPPADGTIPARDNSLPVRTTDAIVVRDSQATITKVDAIYDGDEVVRIELQVVAP